MADEATTDEEAIAQAASSGEGRFNIQKLYLKDVSFESPGAPGIFAAQEEWQPSVDLQLNTEYQACGEALYEVSLHVTVTATQGERTVFLVELKQAGLFVIAGLDEATFQHVTGSHCPAILFPYVRAAVADLVQQGGLPELVLQPLDFDNLYARQMAEQQSGDALH